MVRTEAFEPKVKAWRIPNPQILYRWDMLYLKVLCIDNKFNILISYRNWIKSSEVAWQMYIPTLDVGDFISTWLITNKELSSICLLKIGKHFIVSFHDYLYGA